MSLVSIVKNIKELKKNISDLKTIMYLELDNFKKEELKKKLLENENTLGELENNFKLQFSLYKKKSLEKSEKTLEKTLEKNNKQSNENNVILDTSTSTESNLDNMVFLDDYTISKQTLIDNFNDLQNFKEEKRKFKKNKSN
jgi:hypothetical protein